MKDLNHLNLNKKNLLENYPENNNEKLTEAPKNVNV